MNKKRFRFLAIAAVLLAVNTFFACCIQSDGFRARVYTVDILTEESQTLNAKLYLPKSADTENPRPAVILSAGGNSEYFMVEPFAVEMVKRGYIVAAYTPYKHGMSSIYETADMGASSMVDYVSSLPMVKEGQIGLLGQSRGGVYLTMAAAHRPEAVASVLTIDYVPELLRQTGFTAETPVDFGVICNRFNEYLPDPLVFRRDEQLQGIFGADEEIVPALTYYTGGGARLVMTAGSLDATYSFHPEVVAKAVDFFRLTLPFAEYQECGVGAFALLLCNNLLGFFAMLLTIFGVLYVLVPEVNGPRCHASIHCGGRMLWLGGLAGCVSYIPLYMLGKRILAPTELFPQNDTNGQLIWSVFVLLFYTGVMVLYEKRHPEESLSLPELSKPLGDTLRQFVCTLCAVGAAYGINALRRSWFGLNFTLLWADFSVFTFRRGIAAITYFLIFLIYFVASGAYQIKFSWDDTHPRRSMIVGSAFTTLGMVALFLLHIAGFFITGHSLFYWGRFAFSPILYMLPLLPAVGAFTGWCYRRTRTIYTGAFLNALLLTWLFVASNAFFYM